MDLSTVVPCCSGPKRPHDRVTVTDMKADFKQCLSNKTGFKVFSTTLPVYSLTGAGSVCVCWCLSVSSFWQCQSNTCLGQYFFKLYMHIRKVLKMIVHLLNDKSDCTE